MSESAESGTALGRSVKAGVAWSMVAFAITKGLGLVSTLVLTRLLAPSQFGVVAGVTIVLSVIELTADLGMSAAVIYEQERGMGDRVQVAFTVNLMLAGCLAAAGVLAAPLIANWFHAGHHVWLFRLAAADILFTALGQIHDGLLLRDMRFNLRIVSQVVNSVVQAIVGVTLALLGFGAAALVWGLIASTAAWTVTLWLLTGFRPTLRFDRAIARSMISYGIGASMLGLLAQVTTQADTTVVGRVLGRRALGLYAVAFRLPSLLLENIASQVSLVAFPALARKRVRDEGGVGASTARLVHYQSLYALPLAAGMAVMARPIVVTLFSAKWRDASGVFAAVSVMSGVSASAFALGDAFKALGRQRVMVGLTLIQIPVLVATIIAVAPLGITAVAWARAAGVGFWVALMVTASARVLKIHVGGTLAAMWPGTVAAAGVAAGTGAVRLWSGLPAVPELLAAAVAGALVGGAALALCSPSSFRELVGVGGQIRARLRAARGGGAGVDGAAAEITSEEPVGR
jgi:PST family polysaccharide transporter